MRLGGPAFISTHEPGEWIAYLRTQGYRAAYCPVTTQDDAPTRRAFRQAAQDAGIIIAEVGAWSNPLSPDDVTRTAAIRYCQDQLALADEMEPTSVSTSPAHAAPGGMDLHLSI